jgi:hypothetical protein
MHWSYLNLRPGFEDDEPPGTQDSRLRLTLLI